MKQMGMIDRRAFIMGTLGVTGTAAMAGIAGCAPKAPAQNPTDLADTAATSTTLPSIDESQISETIECDILVCGAGAAGLSAAAAAAEEGARVVCLEKCETSCAGGFNYGFINCRYLLDAGAPRSDENAPFEAITQAHMGGANPKLVRRFIDANPTVGDWHVSVANETGVAYHLAPLEGVSVTNFDDAYKMLAEHTVKNGGELRYSTSVVQLNTDENGAITGAVAETGDGTYIRFNTTKGVILATGGIGGNPDLIREYMPWLDPDTLLDAEPNSSQGGEDGDAIPLTKAIGACIGEGMFSEQIHFLHGYWPKPGVLFVDKSGDRIPDNATHCDLNEIRIHEIMRRPGHSSWAITDSKDGWVEFVNPQAAVKPDYEGVRATNFATLDEVAESFGLDAEGLKATIEGWNAMVEAGEDPYYGTDLSAAMKIDTPPFHCVEAKGCTMSLMGGPLIDSQFRVVDESYAPIRGLYAVGNCCAGFWGPDYIMSVWAGMNKSWAAVSGYLAAKDIVGAQLDL